jgi:spectrin beta
LMPNEMEPEKMVEEWTQEVRTVPQEVWVEEEIEKVEPRTVLEQRSVPQVKSLYPFSGQGMSMSKGEVMMLIEFDFSH